MTEEIKWVMQFDLNTLEHLGVKLYTQYPPMIAELISNSWDADALTMDVKLYDKGEKRIVVSDDGHSMSAQELNTCFLTVGRNRRVAEGTGQSVNGRPVLGKKGIGKLSMFGIAEQITVTTIKDSVENSFSMNYPDMKGSGGSYSPTPITEQQPTKHQNGTTIILDNIKRKSAFDPHALARSLSRRFSIFDEMTVDIYHNDTKITRVKNKNLFDDIDQQFEWEFPSDFVRLIDDLSYYQNNKIHGVLRTSATPLKKNQQGVTLLARRKLVQENAFFDDRSNDYFHSYLYGMLNVDFIDEDSDVDNVSTDRKSLIWEGEDLEELKLRLNDVLKAVANDWRKQRVVVKKKKFKKEHGVDIDAWLDTLSGAERPLAKSIARAILNNTKMEEDRAASLFQHIQDVFSLQGFQNFAESLKNIGALDETNAIQLLKDWEFIEAKEMARLADGRINTIKQFAVYIETNASETKVMQKFLAQFPWILDPRMTNFDREVSYSKWLKTHFPDEKLDESNRRIDFLCTNTNGVVHIIELKRPNIKIGESEIMQCASYKEFIESKVPDTVKEIKVILISENHKYGSGVKTVIDALRAKGNFEIKSYSDLLTQAEKYHKDFINAYDDLLEMKNSLNKKNKSGD